MTNTKLESNVLEAVLWSEAVCGERQRVESGSVWSEAACGVRQCVK